MSDKDAPISPENKLIARYAAAAFGGTIHVDEYVNDSDTLSVGILSCRDRPGPGVTSYSTIKLSDHPMPWRDGEYPTRLELAGLCMNDATYFPNVLASAAFTIVQSDELYHPGSVVPDVVRQHNPSTSLPHLYLAEPFLWGDALDTLDCGTKKVSWLLGVPISDAEYAYLQEHGDEAFETLLEQEEADFSNPDRASLV